MNDEDHGSSNAGGDLTRSEFAAETLERILDLPLVIHVELGNRRMRISELLQVTVGGVLDLDAAAGAPLGIYANRTLIAQGEAVVVGERYGIRVTEIVTPAERIKRLGHRVGGLW
jgi:flagellar motor switch protein FliN/FliY